MRLFLVLACFVVANCGPPQATTQDVKDPPSAPKSYVQFLNDEANLRSLLGSSAVTNAQNLPGQGSAVFAGVVLMDAEVQGSPLALAGALSITANFGANTLSGRADEFIDENAETYSGHLTMTNGTIDRNANPATQYAVFSDIDGSLTGAPGRLDLSGDMIGDFWGSQGAGLSGIIAGTTNVGAQSGYLFGSFIAVGP